MGASPCSTNTWEHCWLMALLFMDGAGNAFLQWGSGFISPGSSGLCVLVAGKGFKASLVGRLSFWAESKLKVDPPFIRQWHFHVVSSNISQATLAWNIIYCLITSCPTLCGFHLLKDLYCEIGESQHRQNYKYLNRDRCMKSNWVEKTDVDKQLEKNTGLNFLKY